MIKAIRHAAVVELRSIESVRLGAGRKAVRDSLRKWQPVCDDTLKPIQLSAKPVLEFREYLALVEETFAGQGLVAGATDEECVQLLDYLHHSGAVYSPTKWRQGKYGVHPIIVDQRWAIDAIYQPFLPGSAAREELLEADGVADADLLDDLVWEDRDANGQRLYSRDHQWIFREFMVSCGIMVPLSEPGSYVLPELLPKKKNVEKSEHDPLVRAIASPSQPGRPYYLRHRALGSGFGCLLVARLLSLFGKSPVFRYGGIGRVEVGGGQEWEPGIRRKSRKDQPRLEAVVLVEWHREDEDAYNGDIIITCYGGDEARDVEILHYLWEELGKIPEFPKEAEFELQSGKPVASLARLRQLRMPGRLREMENGKEPMPVARSIPRLLLVGISVAGEDDSRNKGIEVWPRALRAASNLISGRGFEVLYYVSDTIRKTVSELIGDLASSDLMIAFVGKKYLHSEYCMVEFLKAAQFWQPQETFSNPTAWPHRLWVLPLKDAATLLARTDKQEDEEEKKAASGWCRAWRTKAAQHTFDVTKEFDGDDIADRVATAKYPYHEWMALAKNSQQIVAPVLGALKQARHGWTAPRLPDGLDPAAAGLWAQAEIQGLAEAIVSQIQKISEGLTKEVRQNRLRIRCLICWQRCAVNDAVEAFDYWIDCHPEASKKRAEYLGESAMSFQDLEPVRQKWRELQIERKPKTT